MSSEKIDYQCWICPICFDDHSKYTHDDCIKKAFDSVSRYRYTINQALEILNRPHIELTNVDKVAMVKRILEG